MSHEDEVVDWFRQLYENTDYRNRRPGKTGRIVNGALDPNPVNGAPVGYLHVREGEDGERGEAIALIVGIRDDIADLPIELGERVPGGELCAIRPLISARSNSQLPGQLPAAGVPRTPEPLDTALIGSIKLKPFHLAPSKLYPSGGTLYVYIEPFWYEGRRYGDAEHDVGSANVPTGTNEMRWVWVVFDIFTKTFSTEVAAITTYSNPDEMPIVNATYGVTSITLPVGSIPSAPPLLLTEDQTEITAANIQYAASRFEDTRHWFTPVGLVVVDTSAAANGDVPTWQTDHFEMLPQTGGGGGGATDSDYLTSDVTMTNADTFYTGASLTPAAGTWLLMGSILGGATTNNGDYEARLYDGTNTLSTAYAEQATGVNPSSLSLTAIVVADGLTTYELQLKSAGAGNAIFSQTPATATDTATYLNAIRVA